MVKDKKCDYVRNRCLECDTWYTTILERIDCGFLEGMSVYSKVFCSKKCDAVYYGRKRK